MPSSNYNDLPSSAVESVDIDHGTDVVTVVYKSNPTKKYYYEVADGAEFDRQFLAEFDNQDFSVGAYLNEKKSTNVMREHRDPASHEMTVQRAVAPRPVVTSTGVPIASKSSSVEPPSMFEVNAAKFVREKPEVGGTPRNPETR
jgi:hypothetical protein